MRAGDTTIGLQHPGEMGAAVGQVPEYVEMITSWVKEVATIPVLVKLTPNITNIEASALASKAGGWMTGQTVVIDGGSTS